MPKSQKNIHQKTDTLCKFVEPHIPRLQGEDRDYARRILAGQASPPDPRKFEEFVDPYTLRDRTGQLFIEEVFADKTPEEWRAHSANVNRQAKQETTLVRVLRRLHKISKYVRKFRNDADRDVMARIHKIMQGVSDG